MLPPPMRERCGEAAGDGLGLHSRVLIKEEEGPKGLGPVTRIVARCGLTPAPFATAACSPAEGTFSLYASAYRLNVHPIQQNGLLFRLDSYSEMTCQ